MGYKQEMALVYDIWSVLTVRQRRWVLGAQVLSIAMAFSTVIGIASIAPFFSLLGDPKLVDQTGFIALAVQTRILEQGQFHDRPGTDLHGTVILANLINVVGSFVMIRLALWISTDLQSILFDEYLHRPYIFHARTPSAVLYNNIVNETIRAASQILQNAFSLITNSVTALFIIVSVLLLNPAVAGAMIGALAGGYVLIYLAVRNRLLRAGRVQSQHFIELTKIVNESLGAIKEILVLRTQHYFRSSFARSSERFGRAAAHTQLIAQSPRYVMESVAVVGPRGPGALGEQPRTGNRPLVGTTDISGICGVSAAADPATGIRGNRQNSRRRPGFTAIAGDLRLARARKHAAAAADSPWRESPRSEIRLEEITFCYEPGRPPAIDGVSLRIPCRAAIGFVGANGSGKTTLVDLIAGLLVPAHGRIEVDGILLDDGNRTAWQSRIAYVPQNIFLLDASIAQMSRSAIPGRPSTGETSHGGAAGTAGRNRLDPAGRLRPCGGRARREAERRSAPEDRYRARAVCGRLGSHTGRSDECARRFDRTKRPWRPSCGSAADIPSS